MIWKSFSGIYVKNSCGSSEKSFALRTTYTINSIIQEADNSKIHLVNNFPQVT